VAYPFFNAMRLLYKQSLETKATAADKTASVQWLMYWMVYFLFGFLERNVIFFICDVVPLYAELRLVIFFWLVYPELQGAAWLWYGVLQQPVKAAVDLYAESLEPKVEKYLAYFNGPSTKFSEFTTARESDKDK